MKNILFTTTKQPPIRPMQALLNNHNETHLHAVDMPYRLTSIWQDHDGEVGLWMRDDALLAWALFQPAWFNVDFALDSSLMGSSLEAEIFEWGKDQMQAYANRTGYEFWGSFEFSADSAHAENTKANFEATGFKPFDWSVLQFTLDLTSPLPKPQLQDGFKVRPLLGHSEVDAYVILHRAAFQSDIMTTDWRRRTLENPNYRPEFDLVVVDADQKPVGFCICWVIDDTAHIEPLGIHPDFQGLGLGKALELSAAHLLKEYGINYLQVDHGTYNETAIAVSKKTGFRQTKNALRYYVEVNPSKEKA